MPSIDLNCDLGESFGAYTIGMDAEVLPFVSSANIAYKMIIEMGLAESIGPIQMGLNKPVHILDVESSVRDIVNMTTIAVLDAIVEEQIKTNNLKRIS